MGGMAGIAASSWLLSTRANKAEAATTSATPPVGASICDDAISHLRDPKTGKEIYLIGTAHISNASAQLVRTTIREIKPQTVMLELDEGRINRVQNTTKEGVSKTYYQEQRLMCIVSRQLA